MNLLCKLGFHKYEGTYIEGIDGEKHKPYVYNIPESGVLEGWKRCSRCGEFYEKTYWGDSEKIRVLLEE